MLPTFRNTTLRHASTSMHQNNVERGLLRIRWLDPIPTVSESVSGLCLIVCISNKFPGEVTLLVQGPRFENHYPKRKQAREMGWEGNVSECTKIQLFLILKLCCWLQRRETLSTIAAAVQKTHVGLS